MTTPRNHDRQISDRPAPVKLTADERMMVTRINEQTRRESANQPQRRPRLLFTLGIY